MKTPCLFLLLVLILLFGLISADVSLAFYPDGLATVHFGRSRTYDVGHMKLEIALDEIKKIVSGKVTYSLTPLNNNLREIELDCVDLTVNKAYLVDGSNLSFENSSGKLKIKLPQAENATDQINLTIEYQGSPQMGLFFIQPDKYYPNKPYQIWSQGEDEDNRYWYPSYDFPNDRFTSEKFVTVKSKFTVVSNGKLVEVTEDKNNGTKTYHWKEDIPHVNYLNSIIVGEFEEHKEDFEGIPVYFYVPKGKGDLVKYSFSKTVDMLKFFSEKIGVKYPYKQYAQTTITDFMWGGMENISATTLTERTLHDRIAHMDVKSEGLVAHELAHQWWGDLLTCKDWSHIWLNEGFATFFEALYRERDLGEDEYQLDMQGSKEAYLDEDSREYRRPIVYNSYTAPIELFDSHSYSKGAWVLHMLRGYLEEESFWKGIKNYCTRYREQCVDSHDFQKAMEEATGQNLEWFFSQWVYKAGYPEFKVRWRWEDSTKTAVVSISQNQKTDSLTPIFQTPVEMAFTTPQGRTVKTIQVENKEQEFYLPLDSRPLIVEFDPENKILKTVDFERSTDELLYQLKNSPRSWMRMEACLALSKKGGEKKILEGLENTLLDDEFYGVRQAAARALGEIKLKEAFQILKKDLSDPDSRVRRSVISALGKFKDEPELAEILYKQFKSDSSYYAKAEALVALGKTKNKKVYNWILEGLKYDSHNDVIRASVFDGLVQLDEPKGIGLAKEYAVYGKPQPVRNSAISALGKLGKGKESVTASKTYKREEIREFLENLLWEPIFDTKRAVVNALGELSDPDAIPELEKFIERELQARLKGDARLAIKKIREGKKEEVALKELRDKVFELEEENKGMKTRLEVLEREVSEKK